jgi:hypothetical protein
MGQRLNLHSFRSIESESAAPTTRSADSGIRIEISHAPQALRKVFPILADVTAGRLFVDQVGASSKLVSDQSRD